MDNNLNIFEQTGLQIVINSINKELKSKKIYDIEYLLINNSVESVSNLLNDNSDLYNLIKDDKLYSDGEDQYTYSDLIACYLETVKREIDSLLIPYDISDRNFEIYYDKLKEPTNIQYPKSDVNMHIDNINKTLQLMREAIQAYYKVYNGKRLVAIVSTEEADVNEELEFSIKEEQLMHLLGVTADQIRNNPDFIRLTGNSFMSTSDILKWLMTDLEGNQDLMQFSEDFIKRIQNNRFLLTRSQVQADTQYRIINYHKVRVKSHAFLKYGPLEKVSLVAKLGNGMSLTQNSRSNTVMISRADSFRSYPWAYFGSVQDSNRHYIETLLIDSASGKREVLRGSTPAIIKGVYSEGDDSPESGGKFFSLDNQLDLICKACEEFGTIMNLNSLISYYKSIINGRKR